MSGSESCFCSYVERGKRDGQGQYACLGSILRAVEKPFRGTNIAEFKFEPRGEQTAVTWTMTGQKNFVAKAIHLFMSMDKMIGGAFEQGRAQMKSLVESSRR